MSREEDLWNGSTRVVLETEEISSFINTVCTVTQ